MRLERRFSSMTQQYNPAYKKKLVKDNVLEVWFHRYLEKKGLKFTKPLTHYVGLVAEWETKVMVGRAFCVFGMAFALIGCLAQFLVHFRDVSQKMDYRIFSGAMFGLGLFLLYFGFKANARAKKNQPYVEMIRLVWEYRKVLSAFDATVLWDKWVCRPDNPQTENQLSELEEVDPNQTVLPQFLIEAGESKLHELGQRICELESTCKGADATDIRDGIFATCFADAITFGVIPKETGYGKFIPEPVL